MKKNSTLQQKLKSYSAVAGAVTAAAAVTTDADAQIIYTDVNPDVTVNTSGTKFDIDLDNNATIDFSVAFQAGTFYGYAYNYSFAYTMLGTTNQIDSANGGTAEAHNYGNAINASNLWWAGYGTYSQHGLAISFPAISYNIGAWVGATDMYMAVKFDISGSNHYGWVRMDVGSNSESITVKDFAYESTPDLAINAGDSLDGVGIKPIELKDIVVFSNNKTINIDLGQLESADVIVRDMSGREIHAASINSGFTRIDLATATEGIYTVSIVAANGRATTRKIALR